MEKKMNKTEFIKQLSNNLSYSEDKCAIINDILESNFFISKKSKNKIIDDFVEKLKIDNKEASYIYEVSTKIVNDEIKYKLKHPFGSQDRNI